MSKFSIIIFIFPIIYLNFFIWNLYFVGVVSDHFEQQRKQTKIEKFS